MQKFIKKSTALVGNFYNSNKRAQGQPKAKSSLDALKLIVIAAVKGKGRRKAKGQNLTKKKKM